MKNNGSNPAQQQKKQDNNLGQGNGIQVKPKRKLTFKEQRELEGLPSSIEAMEGRNTQLEDFFSSGKLDATGETTKEYEATLQQLETMYARWEELEGLV